MLKGNTKDTIDNFGQISHIVLVFLLLALNI